MIKQYALTAVLFFITSTLFGTNQSTFIISETNSKKPASKNELKEEIGDEFKTSLLTCNDVAQRLASLQQEIGSLQQKVASFQRNLLNNTSDLVEDERRFRKAKRREISAALDTMKRISLEADKIKKTCRAQETKLSELVVQMNKNKCLREEKTT